MSVSDVSGKAIANLATEELSHPAPVFHGDTLFVESEVLEKRESRSKPDRGTVKVHTRVFNQDGTLVAEFKRLVLVPRKTPGTRRRRRRHGDPAAGNASRRLVARNWIRPITGVTFLDDLGAAVLKRTPPLPLLKRRRSTETWPSTCPRRPPTRSCSPGSTRSPS